MKKLCAVAVLVVAAAFAFGQGISIGGGISYGSEWMTAGGSGSIMGMSVSGSTTVSMPELGFHGFVDTKYVQVGLGYILNSSQSISASGDFTVTGPSSASDKLSWLDIEVDGKYPIPLGGFTIFPIVGAEYLLNLTYTDSSGNDLKASLPSTYKNQFDALMIKVGVGGDFSIGERFYVRPEISMGYKLIKSQYDTDQVNALKTEGLSDAYLNWWLFRGVILVGYKL